MDPKDKPPTPDRDDFEQDLQKFFQEQNQLWEPEEKGLNQLLAIPEKHPNVVMWNRLLLWFFPVAAIVSVLFLWNVTQEKTDPLFVPKGNLWQILYAHDGSTLGKSILTQELKDGTRLHPGDLVQFSYEVKEPTHVMIVGMNQAGTVYPLVLGIDKKSLLLKPGKGAFPRKKGAVKSFRLDNYTGEERFFIVRSRKAFKYQLLYNSLQDAWKKSGKRLVKVKKVPGPWSILTVYFSKQPHRYGEAIRRKKH